MRAKFVKDSFNESYEPKDLKRVKDFTLKSGGDFQKEVSLARQMANTLTNVNKAIGRAEAAIEVYGGWNEIVEIFYEKAKELGYEGPVPGERLQAGVVLGSKLPKDHQAKPNYPGKYYGSNPILPIGKVDIRTGECKYFNVYETWKNEGIVEVWRDAKGINTKNIDSNVKIDSPSINILRPKSKEEVEEQKRKFFNHKIIFTGGNVPTYQIGDNALFVHDQNRNEIGYWEMVDYVPLKHMRELILPYGSNLSGYVYK